MEKAIPGIENFPYFPYNYYRIKWFFSGNLLGNCWKLQTCKIKRYPSFVFHIIHISSSLKHNSVTSACYHSVLAHPGGGSAVVVNKERPSIGGYPHLPARGQEALLCLVLRLGGAVGRRLGRLRVGERVLYSPPHLDVVGSLEPKWKN